jgi:hypothetical protein
MPSKTTSSRGSIKPAWPDSPAVTPRAPAVVRLGAALAQKRRYRSGILIAGLLVPQLLLLGPTLTGHKVLLPVDVLAHPMVYFPDSGADPHQLREMKKSDLVFDHLMLRWAADEFRAGRIPLWCPLNYAGAPFATYCKYSPFNVLFYLYPQPITLAWMQVFRVLVAGLGAYLFFRGSLTVGFWPAAVGAWCFPLMAFFVLWQGYQVSQALAWLPWLLLCVDRTARRPAGWGGPGLAVVTGLVLVSGQIAIAGQLLLVSGLFALWCLFDAWWQRGGWRRLLVGCAVLGASWLLGFLLASPFVLPLVEFGRSGSRIEKRAAGEEERPPIGLCALPQTVLPYIYGSWQEDMTYIGEDPNLFESAAAGYAGLFAALVAAPLAWCSRRHWGVNFFWLGLIVFALSWVLKLPGFVAFFRLPVLNMMPANRLVFAAGFGAIALAVTGLEALGQGEVRPRAWFVLPVLILLVLGVWCYYHSVELPEALQETPSASQDPAAVEKRAAMRASFTSNFLVGAGLCVAAAAAWLVVWRWSPPRPEFAVLLGVGLVVELVTFQYDFYPQGDPALYYPDIPVLSELARKPPGRVLGCWALPPTLNLRFGLADVRGYDGADPRRLVDLLEVCRHPDRRTYPAPSYAITQYYQPRGIPEGGPLPQALNILNIRYLIFRGDHRADTTPPVLKGDGYSVEENPQAMPRTWVPRQVRTAADQKHVLLQLLQPAFDPARTAYLVEPLDLPEDCQGEAAVVEEIPSRVTLSAHMRTAGLLILADAWYEGWRAFVNGVEVPIRRTDYLLRGIQLPPGHSIVVFRYEPMSFALGVRLMAGGMVVLVLWAVLVGRKERSSAERGLARQAGYGRSSADND